MKTKNQMLETANTNISDTTLIVPQMHRNVNNALIDELYSTSIDETSEEFVYTQPVDADSSRYALKMRKVGNNVFGEIYVSNETESTISVNTLLYFPETVEGQPNPYLPDDGTYDEGATFRRFPFVTYNVPGDIVTAYVQKGIGGAAGTEYRLLLVNLPPTGSTLNSWFKGSFVYQTKY